MLVVLDDEAMMKFQ